MKLLIVGAQSPVGEELCKQLEERGLEYFAPEASEISAQDPVDLAKVVTRYSPSQVINLASFGAGSQLAVSAAESKPEECEQINHVLVSLLAQVCDHLNIPLLHLSTAYVFSGEKKLGYNEEDVCEPVGVYGRTALKGEQAIQNDSDKYIVLRIGRVFGLGQDELIQHWVKEACDNEGAVTVTRRKFSPTPAEDVARVLMAIALQVDCGAQVWGIYHYCGLETKRESEFVQQVLKLAAQHDEKVYRLLDHLSLNLMRPEPPEITNTTLATKKIFDTFGIKQRSWHGALQTLIKAIYKVDSKS
ncbi:MAG: sugar nucleotide-binding protein [Pseudohongiellaceae bacterium]|nr:sugar nucleotide-binding protein [Pseudohongiellaceae bacterium]